MSSLSQAVSVLCGWLFVANSASAADLIYIRSDGGYWHIWRMDVQSRRSVVIDDQPFDKRLLCVESRTGAIYFRDTQGKLFRTSLDGGGPSVVSLAGLDVVKDCAVHPASGFLVSTYAPNAADNLRIWHYGLDGSPKGLLVSASHLNEKPCWLPDGASFFFVHSDSTSSRLMHSSVVKPKPNPVIADPVISVVSAACDPDGQQIVYARRVGEQTDLWLSSSEGTSSQPLYEGPGLDVEPFWPSGTNWIFFSTWDGSHFRIACIRPDGKEMNLITDERADCREPMLVE